jgi:hypothetical protein
MIMHTMCIRQEPRRMKCQPAVMKMVLTKLKEALSAGKSEVEITLKR